MELYWRNKFPKIALKASSMLKWITIETLVWVWFPFWMICCMNFPRIISPSNGFVKHSKINHKLLWNDLLKIMHDNCQSIQMYWILNQLHNKSAPFWRFKRKILLIRFIYNNTINYTEHFTKYLSKRSISYENMLKICNKGNVKFRHLTISTYIVRWC